MRYFLEQEKELEQVTDLPNTNVSAKEQALVFAGVAFLSLMVPFGFGHPQWLVGTIVNTVLFLAVLFLPKKYWLALIIFPSLGALARGAIFGPLTFFLIYFLPFIWAGNYVLMLVFEKTLNKDKILETNNFKFYFTYLFAVLLASLAKFAFLFTAVNLYFNLKVVPKIFVASMGLSQLETALAGGVISLLIYKAFKTWKKI